MKKWIPLIILTLLVLSCKSRKASGNDEQSADSLVVRNSDSNEPIDTGKNVADRLNFYEKIYLHENFEFLKIYSKITADNIRVSPLDAIIYIETDKKIWSKIDFIVFNAARALISPDGIKAMDKYNKNYIDSDFEYLNNLLNVHFFDYKNLEKLLVGRTFFTLSNKNAKITKNMEGYQMESISNLKFTTENGEREYKLNLQYSEDYNLEDLKLKDVKSDDAIEIVYSNWETQPNNVKLPKNVKIIIKGSKNSQILIENTNFVFSRMDTPYSVPSSYKKIEIK
ncbi:protein of unknown function [Chryseobacterium piscicola]|jgi:hypothetical protein|uniref:DUF4292 domain-containing protein n=2 Tax=Chryseobacterium TaxID=59732 RepID=A0A1N7KM85_9FLAO|nr:DUF4292 domain-containing protein [Chryseobacterium piscicola]PQA96176.1 hypothetical protein B0A70_03380 [Chryseobacterium piscicola]SIS62713.1 protein of unknown function [Chryseobacterium piscicola]